MRALIALIALCAACSTSPQAIRTDPDNIHWEIAGALTGHHCDDEPQVVEGKKPDDAQSLGMVRMSGRARPLSAYKAQLQLLAHKRCAEGATVRNAVDDGAGVVRLEAVLWERPPP